MFVRLILGLYSELSKNIFFKVIARCYCLCFVVFIFYSNYSMLLTYPPPIKVAITTVHKLMVYTIVTVASMLSNGEHFYEYLNEMSNIETKSKIKPRKFELIISLTTFVVIIILYTFFLFHNMTFANKNAYLEYYFGTLTLLFMAKCFNNMARVMMFELLWDRMKSLRMMMVENLKFCELVSDDHVELQISKLEEYIKVYNNLLDNLKYMGHASKLMIILNLPSYFIYVISVMLEFIKYRFVDMFYLFDGVANTMIPLVPAILAELVTIQVEKMKTHLSQQLLVCSHNGLRNRVCDALKFLELRPFKYTVWRAFSLNTSLLLGLISLCTTYTIVAIQFSHVYG
ncbi:uncharacterized protein LOC120633566 [Pararge aegeria]|uniref:uncharacterized protein LOC120633566 n=1 Tax=Pararge aegeria TaxID=116150 RepID=UPI0019D2FBAC|nr:uncharacterized protein LOC120633566 [Pararge aegeria]